MLEVVTLHLGMSRCLAQGPATQAVGSTLASGLVAWEGKEVPVQGPVLSFGVPLGDLNLHPPAQGQPFGGGRLRSDESRLPHRRAVCELCMLNSLLSLLLWLNTLSSHRATSLGTQTCFGASIDTRWAFLGRLEAAVRRSDRPLYRPLSYGQPGAKL